MPSGNVPLGTLDAGPAIPQFSDSALSDPPFGRLRHPARSGETARHWYHLSFRTLLALVCLQVFVLLAAGFGLLISAQHKRAQVHRRNCHCSSRPERHVIEDTTVLAKGTFGFGATVDVVEHHTREPTFGEPSQIGDIDGPGRVKGIGHEPIRLPLTRRPAEFFV